MVILRIKNLKNYLGHLSHEKLCCQNSFFFKENERNKNWQKQKLALFIFKANGVGRAM
jgi:hypothetical protein